MTKVTRVRRLNIQQFGMDGNGNTKNSQKRIWNRSSAYYLHDDGNYDAC